MISPDADWVIIGQQHADGGVIILASSTVREAHLREELRVHATGYGDVTTKIAMTVRIGDYIKVRGTTYAEAFALLLDRWSPPSDLTLAVGDRL